MKIKIGKIGAVATTIGGVLISDAAIKFSRKFTGKNGKGTFVQNLIESTICTAIMAPTTILSILNWTADQEFDTKPNTDKLGSMPFIGAGFRQDIVNDFLDLIPFAASYTGDPADLINNVDRIMARQYPIFINRLEECAKDIKDTLREGDTIKAIKQMYTAAEIAAYYEIYIVDETEENDEIYRLRKELEGIEEQVINKTITGLEAVNRLIDIRDEYSEKVGHIIDAFQEKLACIAEENTAP